MTTGIIKLLKSSSHHYFQKTHHIRQLQTDHTKFNKRQFIPTKITEILHRGSEKTPVKIFKLAPKQPIKYLPGQWIDLQPSDPKIRLLGLSLTNFSARQPEVAVKISPHPAVQWLHNTACPGSTVEIAVGEDTSFALSEKHIEESSHILFIAGGIGITPCMSMLDYLSKLKQDRNLKVSLINLQKCEANDVFKEHLESLHDRLDYDCHTLYSRTEVPAEIPKILDTLTDESGVRCYLCGPPGMMQSIIDMLNERGIYTIITEQWAAKAFDLHMMQNPADAVSK